MYKYLILLVVSFSAFADLSVVGEIRCFSKQSLAQSDQEVSNLEREQIEAVTGEFCTYTIQNLANVNELARKTVQALFDGRPLIYPEGILEAFGNNDQTLIFSHSDPAKMNQMKNLIPSLDTRESFAPSEVVRIKADIYEVTETGLNNIGAGISNLRLGTGINDGLDDSFVASGTATGLGVDLRAGAVELSAFINREKANGHLRRVTQVRGDSYNLNNFSFSDITTVYQAPGAGTSISQEEEGIKINAKVSVNAENQNTVVLRDFNFYYGEGFDRVSPSGTVSRAVNKITIPAQRLILQEGIMIPIISENIQFESSLRSRGFLSFGNESERVSTRLLIFISADVLSWEEYISELNSINIQSRSSFTPAQRALLPSTCPSESEVLQALNLHAVRGEDGAPVLSFSLDDSVACKTNLNKRIYIDVEGGGIPGQANESVRTVEQLIHSPIRIQGIPDSSFSRSYVHFSLMLQYFNRRRTATYHRLYYSPSTFSDISQNFWIE
ncbi:MAG: hypothetical protein CME65_05985 [Halobacteriovoraceae bacterium]|nr:hypothetical protein [Halobacteriovoraceae bacterium]|tara:strand:+ start:18247 stop:19743 length:1497 start_codon:yes stop_codon:yes gene_type:complete